MALDNKFRLRGIAATPGAAATPLDFTLNDGTTVQEIPIPVNVAFMVLARVMAVSSGGVVRGWNMVAQLKRGAGAVALVGAPVIDSFPDAGAVTWALNAVATAAGFRVDATGAAATAINWVCEMEINLLQP